jgi:hypothetical protein
MLNGRIVSNTEVIMKVSKFLFSIFLLVGIREICSYEYEFDINTPLNPDDVGGYLNSLEESRRQRDSFADLFSYSNFLGRRDSAVSMETDDDVLPRWQSSSPTDDETSRPVTQERIDAEIGSIIDNQSIMYDSIKGHVTTNCVFCKKGFGEYGGEKRAMNKLKNVLKRHYSKEHRSDIIIDKIYKK